MGFPGMASVLRLSNNSTPCSRQINIPNADLEEVGLELAGKGGAAAATLGGGVEDESSSGVDISVVTVKPNQKTILFANTEFLTAQARGEVFNNERPTAVPE